MNHSLTTVETLTRLGYAPDSNTVRDNCCAQTGTTPDDASDEDLLDNDNNDFLVIEKTSIDNVVLGAPLCDLDATSNTPCPPIIYSVTTITHDPQSTESEHRQIEAGCAWDRINWSCSYDSVFMSFWFIYRYSSSGWRSKWRQQAPKWNDSLGGAFDSLLSLAQSSQSSEAELSRKFTSLRETFRNDLSRVNPTHFQHHGQVLASVCRILGHIFVGSGPGESEPHLEQMVACDWCNTSAPMRCSFGLLGSDRLLEIHRRDDDIEPFLPLQIAVTRYIQHFSQKPQRDRCRTCFGPLRVASLSMPETTWLWIELSDPISPVTPSPRLVFGLKDQLRVYTLRAVIYTGGDHFTARLLDQSATWWKYDGMWRFGVPRVDQIDDELGLLENDHRRAAFLIYCEVDRQD